MIEWLSENSRLVSSLSSIVVALSAVATILLARRGLTAWEKEYLKKANHKLAKQLLISFYKFSDCIKAIRSRYISFPPASIEDYPGASNEELEFLGRLKYYEKLNEEIANAEQEIYSNLVNAEIAFGPDIRCESRQLIGLKKQLICLLWERLEAVNPETDKGTEQSILSQLNDEKYQFYSAPNEDAFQEDFDNRLDKIADILRKQLLHSK